MPETTLSFAGLLDARFAGREERQFVVGRFEQSTREHPKEFRRRVDRQVERLARDRLLALFAAIFPARFAILHFKALFDRRFHVIIAAAFVFGRNAGGIDFPSGNDVIAAAAIVVGIFSADGAGRFSLHGLCAGQVALQEYLVRTLRVRRLREAGEH